MDVSAAVSTALQPLVKRIERLELPLPSAAADSATATGTLSVVPSSDGGGNTHSLALMGSGGLAHTPKFWSTVSQPIIDKVTTGQFVELHLLLPPNPAAAASPQILTLGEGPQGQLSLSSQPRASRRITDLETWLEAWTNFAAIYTHAHPSKALELLGYQHIIAKACKKYKFTAVAEYDRLFRCHVASQPSLRWDCVLQNLYTTVFDSQAVAPFRTSAAATTGAASSDFCRLFNRGKCTRSDCRYKHSCFRCHRHGHAEVDCTAKIPSKRTITVTQPVDTGSSGSA